MYSYSIVKRKIAQVLLNLSPHVEFRKIGFFKGVWPSHQDRVNYRKSRSVSSLDIPIGEQVPPYNHGSMGSMSIGTRKNKQGDELIDVREPIPPGYKFVPSGVHFVTRRCRELAQKRYAVMKYKSQGGDWHIEFIGLYVPESMCKEVDIEYKAKMATRVEAFWAGIRKDYPGMPPDEEKLFRESQLYEIDNDLVGRIPTRIRHEKVRHYVRQRYVQVEHAQHHSFKKSVSVRGEKHAWGNWAQTFSEKRREKIVEEILELWRHGGVK